MDKYKQLLVSATTCAIIIIAAKCIRPVVEARHSTALQVNANTAVYKKPTASRGEAEGEVLPFDFTGDGLRTAVLSHPAPKTWLVYRPLKLRDKVEGAQGARPATRVELPQEAERVLRTHWEFAISAQYDWEMTYVSDVEKRTQLSVAIINSSQRAASELTKIPIDAPDGTRPITLDEANDLVQFTGQAVVDVVKQAKSGR